jgi:hypothetical protein
MSQVTLEERVSRLEQLYEDWVHGELAGRQAGRDDWLKTLGMFAGDPVMKEIIEEGRLVREQDRQQSCLGSP